MARAKLPLRQRLEPGAVIPESEATEAILDHLGIDAGPSNATGPPGH